MNKPNNQSRITIDIPEEDHKKFKALAAFLGKSMRELVVESIQQRLEQSPIFASHRTLRK
ncbi:MAG TPA: hypothetical protein PLU71_05050 [Candidatus Dependentiae bacterium]|nr:hypothetical protein [Candidatus Dependentiae bacterium]HRQ63203.1 hypothetical protein [Candidatus Dependentiae bacterium]